MTTWIPIVGIEPGYEVSDDGHVRSLPRMVPGPKPGGMWPVRGRVLGEQSSKGGHLRVWIRNRPFLVHRLVLEAFIGPAPEGAEGCHNDGDPSNNRVENLRWDTRSHNAQDSVRHGTHRNARKTHCLRGHELSGDNIFISKKGSRECRACHKIRADRRRSLALAEKEESNGDH